MVAEFNRFDICEAYSALEADYNTGGILLGRPSCRRRMESVGVQLVRIGYSNPYGNNTFSELNENAKFIYADRVLSWGLPIDEELDAFLRGNIALEYLAGKRPELYAQAFAHQI